MSLSPIPEVQATSVTRDRSPAPTEKKFQSRTVCAICTKNFKHIPYVIPCGHSFHRSCLQVHGAVTVEGTLKCFECKIPYRREQAVPNAQMRDLLNDLELQNRTWDAKYTALWNDISKAAYSEEKKAKAKIAEKDEEISRLNSEIVRLKALFRPIEFVA